MSCGRRPSGVSLEIGVSVGRSVSVGVPRLPSSKSPAGVCMALPFIMPGCSEQATLCRRQVFMSPSRVLWMVTSESRSPDLFRVRWPGGRRSTRRRWPVWIHSTGLAVGAGFVRLTKKIELLVEVVDQKTRLRSTRASHARRRCSGAHNRCEGMALMPSCPEHACVTART